MNDIKQYYIIKYEEKWGFKHHAIIPFEKISYISFSAKDIYLEDGGTINDLHHAPQDMNDDFIKSYKEYLSNKDNIRSYCELDVIEGYSKKDENGKWIPDITDIEKTIIPFQKIKTFSPSDNKIYIGSYYLYLLNNENNISKIYEAFYDYQKWLENKYK